MPLNPQRTIDELKELRALTSNADGAQRVAWTDTWLKAREWFASKLQGLPVEHHYDAAGNNWVTLPGASEKCLLIGGHLDSVPNGGWLDGALNVIAALELLRRFNEQFDGKPPVTIRVVDWADEEGARFGRSLLGSSAFAGTHSIAADRMELWRWLLGHGNKNRVSHIGIQQTRDGLRHSAGGVQLRGRPKAQQLGAGGMNDPVDQSEVGEAGHGAQRRHDRVASLVEDLRPAR